MSGGWIGVDFDGTLASMKDGSPIESMVERVKQFLAQGVEVRIVTARVNSKMTFEHKRDHTFHIERWCLQHLGRVLPVQAEKEYDMVLLYDDRAMAVQTDTGAVKGWFDEVMV